MNDIKLSGLTSTGFTGVQVFNETMDNIFKGTSPKESFLLVSLISDTGMPKKQYLKRILRHQLMLATEILAT